MKTPVSRARCLPNATHCAVRRTPTIQTLLRTQQQEYVLSLSLLFFYLSPSLFCRLLALFAADFSSVLLFLHPPSVAGFFFNTFPSSILSLLCTSYIVTIFPFFSLHAKPVFCDYCLKVLLTPVGQKQKNPQKKRNRKKKKRAPKKKAFTHAYLLLPTPTHTHKKIITTRSDFPLYHHHFLFSSPPPLSSVTRCCCVLFAPFLSTLHLPQVVLS